MIDCVYAAKWNGDPCDHRRECLDSCRAGWLATPANCEGCGVPLTGPLTATLIDDGEEGVIFRIACLRCAPALVALEEAERIRYINVAWMLRPPRKAP